MTTAPLSNDARAIEELRSKLGGRLTIVGHHYEQEATIQHCDIRGDSLELARRVPGIASDYIVFCGVYFMAESAALLAREGQQVREHLVIGVLDFSNALKKLANINYQKEAVEEGAVLNGIAWDSAGSRMFVTGKRWPKLLEIKLN